MAEVEIIERLENATVIRTGGGGGAGGGGGGGGGGGDQKLTIPHALAILPVRNVVVFPGTIMPLNVGRAKSKALLDAVMPGEKLLGVVTQRDAEAEDPGPEGLYTVGVVCSVLKLFRLPDGNQSIIVHGLARFRLKAMEKTEPYAVGNIEIFTDSLSAGTEMDALMASVRQQAGRVIELSPNTPEEAQQVLNSISHPSAMSDFLAANLQSDTAEKQSLLEEPDVEKRLRLITARLASQLDVLELQDKIQSQVKENIDKQQRKYFLQEQLKAIRKELGEETGEDGNETESLRKKLEAAQLPEAVMKEAQRELQRLETIPQASPEFGVIRSYLQLLGELPWAVLTEDRLDLAEARATLDRDHHGLEKVKRRILEHLAVRKLKPDGAGAILCLVGPPGVGKTSLGKSIASAMGRKFIRVALGGVRDEADIRGHRRTYIGSMPGRIIAEIRKAGTRNPLMMLDEIDKLSSDFRGDPASALLEVLDPAQNSTFTDHYMDVPFDLSKVLFIATANTMHTVPAALTDRMEVIEIPGYSDADKLAIAKTYLVPRQLEACGLTPAGNGKAASDYPRVRLTDEAVKWLISSYTREAGVRNLERHLHAVCRSVAADVVSASVISGAAKNETAKTAGAKVNKAKATSKGKTAAKGKSALRQDVITIDAADVTKILGPRMFEPELAGRTSVPGVATGLAYTPVGGEILFVEATRMTGKGNIVLTGQIGDVMKESATAAFSLVRSRAESLGIKPGLLAESDIHIHVPAGAIPKDGPSAGVAMFTALASLLLRKAVRPDLAMTGEITLRGLVLPVGGIKEKILAAHRAGITHVVLPKRNEKDLHDVPAEVKKALTFHFASTLADVLKVAVSEKPAGKSQLKKRKK